MQRKVVFDTCVYIDIFNDGFNTDQINWFQNITFLAYPVFHELIIGARNKKESNLLQDWAATFSSLGRLIIPDHATIFAIGKVCQAMRQKGKLDPVMPKHYNDISIALLARQIGATVVTKNKKDFSLISKFSDTKCIYII